MKKVIVACGSGVATSQTVASKVTRLLKERKLDEIKVEVVDLKSVDTHIKNSAAYIAITKIEKQYPIPVINGIAFLTGINMEAELQKIIDACK
ncbi:PTS galactitol transporter subunit IIB [Gilliamella sp. Fer1-1]|jgi:galactitol PTS system EIIB component|uniref:PTS sugar transporter subunit IIB n=1 Tax=unclassified Gilliamella TaxID=2685620 RepID=UPI00080DCE6B|nr:PTS sugar transporter subunit IIB [Gilliamella apicola]OCG18043.1 PTS galactitol transporter subunit IIB [Gilliamella apicola]OCG44654.1 PTS galactitol transporter subunit IIB [Gilliamella apicola]OCG76077.1 PTS galactitol transporter subunit IIB [Gilliamella apicola]